ncbi:MAG: transposase [Nitrososphaerota archaeon]
MESISYLEYALASGHLPVAKSSFYLVITIPYGIFSYFTHRVTNAIAEGLNSVISTIRKMAYGYRNKEHFKTAIYFRCGNLQFYASLYSGKITNV